MRFSFILKPTNISTEKWPFEGERVKRRRSRVSVKMITAWLSVRITMTIYNKNDGDNDEKKGEGEGCCDDV